MTVTVIITFTTKAEKLPSFEAVLCSVRDDLPRVAGCNGVSVFRQSDASHIFTLVESWDSIAAHKAHIGHVMSSGAWEHIASHLACDPISAYFHPL